MPKSPTARTFTPARILLALTAAALAVGLEEPTSEPPADPPFEVWGDSHQEILPGVQALARVRRFQGSADEFATCGVEGFVPGVHGPVPYHSWLDRSPIDRSPIAPDARQRLATTMPPSASARHARTAPRFTNGRPSGVSVIDES